MRRLLLLPVLLLAGCGGAEQVSPNLPRGAAAYGVIPPAGANTAVADYHISPFDTVQIDVYGEPDLSVKSQQVDATGTLSLPLIGPVPASGKTALELSNEVQRLFAQKYLRNPQVTVNVDRSITQKVSIQGEVSTPGVYDLRGPTTLLEAISMAKGEQRTARLDQVVVFRTVNGQRMGAVFDVQQIRAGEANDPQILGNDIIVVGYSQSARNWEEIKSFLPIFNVFRPVYAPLVHP